MPDSQTLDAQPLALPPHWSDIVKTPVWQQADRDKRRSMAQLYAQTVRATVTDQGRPWTDAAEDVLQQDLDAFAKAGDFETGRWEAIPAAIARGYQQARSGLQVVQGLDDPVNRLDLAEAQLALRESPPASPGMREFQRAEGFGPALGAFARNPFQVFTQTVGESAANMVPSLALGYAGAQGGAALGAVSGAPLFGVGAAPASVAGGMIGGAAGTFAGSFETEKAGRVLGYLAEQYGVDLTNPDAVEKAWADPAIRADIEDKSAKGAFATAAFDAASYPLAGVFSRAAKPTMLSKAGRLLADANLQGALGAAGSAAGSLATGEPVNAQDMIGEYIGEFVETPLEARGIPKDIRTEVEAARRARLDELARQAQTAAPAGAEASSPNAQAPSASPAPAAARPAPAAPALTDASRFLPQRQREELARQAEAYPYRRAAALTIDEEQNRSGLEWEDAARKLLPPLIDGWSKGHLEPKDVADPYLRKKLAQEIKSQEKLEEARAELATAQAAAEKRAKEGVKTAEEWQAELEKNPIQPLTEAERIRMAAGGGQTDLFQTDAAATEAAAQTARERFKKLATARAAEMGFTAQEIDRITGRDPAKLEVLLNDPEGGRAYLAMRDAEEAAARAEREAAAAARVESWKTTPPERLTVEQWRTAQAPDLSEAEARRQHWNLVQKALYAKTITPDEVADPAHRVRIAQAEEGAQRRLDEQRARDLENPASAAFKALPQEEQLARREMLAAKADYEAAQSAFGEDLQTVLESGALPIPTTARLAQHPDGFKAPGAAELRDGFLANIKDPTTRAKWTRTNAPVDLDRIRAAAVEMGFDFATPADLADALAAVARGERVVPSLPPGSDAVTGNWQTAKPFTFDLPAAIERNKAAPAKEQPVPDYVPPVFDPDEIPFSRTASATAPVPPLPETLRLEIEAELQKEMPAGVTVRLHNTSAEANAAMPGAKANETVEGFYDPTTRTAHVIWEGLSPRARSRDRHRVDAARRVALHELAHADLPEFLGEAYDQTMRDAVASAPGDMLADIATRYLDRLSKAAQEAFATRDLAAFEKALTREDFSELGEEIIAEIAEKPALAPGVWQRIVAAVRDYARRLGLKLTLSEDDVRALVQRKREWMQSRAAGAEAPNTKDQGPRQSRKSPDAPLDREDFQNYFDFYAVPDAKRAAAETAIRRIVGDEAGGVSQPARAGGVSPEERDRALRAWRGLGFHATPEQTRETVEALKRGPVSRILRALVRREIPDWNIKGAVIERAADMADLCQSIRSPYFESLKVALLDRQFRVIASRIISVGTINRAAVSPLDIMLTVQEMADGYQGKISGFVIAHNHPSGDPKPSHADQVLTNSIGEAAQSFGVPFLDHVITNGKEYFSFGEAGLAGVRGPVKKPHPKLAKTTEDAAAKPDWQKTIDRSVPPEWELAPGNQNVGYPERARNYLASLKTLDPEAYHIVFLNSGRNVQAVHRVETGGRPSWEQAETLMQEIAIHGPREGAAAFLVSFPYSQDPYATPSHADIKTARALKEYGNTLNMPMADGIITNPDGKHYSFLSSGILEETAPYGPPRQSRAQGTLPLDTPLGTQSRPRYSYAGPTANLTVPQRDAFAAAQAMQAAGKDSETIRALTGWFPGKYDGKLRYEVPDNGVSFTSTFQSLTRNHKPDTIERVDYFRTPAGKWNVLLIPVGAKRVADVVNLVDVDDSVIKAIMPAEVVKAMRQNQGEDSLSGDNLEIPSKLIRKEFKFDGFNALSLGEVLNHPALFAAYPDAKNILVTVDDMTDGGTFHKEDGDSVITLGRGRQLSILLHEIQHWIQHKESFAIGGNINQFETIDRHQDLLQNVYDERSRRFRLIPERFQELARMRNRGEPIPPDDMRALQNDPDAKLAWANWLQADRDATELENLPADQRLAPLTRFEQYRRVAGEIEARDVQARQNFTPEQRQATPPYSSEDIPTENAIVRFSRAQGTFDFTAPRLPDQSLPPLRRNRASDFPRPVVSTSKAADVVAAKKAMADTGETAEQLVARFYKGTKFADLPKDALLVPVPSTTGKNLIPLALATRIQQDHGQLVFLDPVATATAKRPAKEKQSFIEKIEDPVGFLATPKLDDLAKAGRPVVIVEDIHTTGETWLAFASLLRAKGIEVAGVATLAAGENRLTQPADIDYLSNALAQSTGTPLDTVRPLVQNYFHDTYRALHNRAAQAARGRDAQRILAVLRSHAEGPGAQEAGRGAAPDGPQLISAAGVPTLLSQGVFSFGADTPLGTQLPSDLAGLVPNYQSHPVRFAAPLDKWLYYATPSEERTAKHDARLDALAKETGLPASRLRALGRELRQRLAQLAAPLPENERINAPEFLPAIVAGETGVRFSRSNKNEAAPQIQNLAELMPLPLLPRRKEGEPKLSTEQLSANLRAYREKRIAWEQQVKDVLATIPESIPLVYARPAEPGQPAKYLVITKENQGGWRHTMFMDQDGFPTPTGHTLFETRFEAVKDLANPYYYKLAPDIRFSRADEYGINHRPREDGPQADSVTTDYQDLLTHPQYYTAMSPTVMRETVAQLRRVKGKPDLPVTIYRAGPKPEMNEGDWVSLSKEYARTHAMGHSTDKTPYKVWASQVPASQVRWGLDDIAEWGYFGQTVPAQDTGVRFSRAPAEPPTVSPEELAKELPSQRAAVVAAATLQTPPLWQRMSEALGESFKRFRKHPELRIQDRRWTAFREGYRDLQGAGTQVEKETTEQVRHILEPITALGREAVDPDTYAIQQKAYQRVRDREQEIKKAEAALAENNTPGARLRLDTAREALLSEKHKADLATIQEIDKKLENLPYHIMRKFVLFADLAWRAENLDAAGPREITKEDREGMSGAARERDRLAAVIAQHPQREAIEESLRRHYEAMDAMQQELIRRGYLIPEEYRNPFYFPHHILDFANGTLGAPNFTTQDPFRGYLENPTGSMRDVEADYLKAVYQHLYLARRHNTEQTFVERHVLSHDITEKIRADLQEAHDAKVAARRAAPRQITRDEAQQDYNLPPGFERFIVDKRLPMTPVQVIDPKILAENLGTALAEDEDAAQVIARLGGDVRVTVDMLKTIMAQRPGESIVIPSPLARELKGLLDRGATEVQRKGVYDAALRHFINFWKRTKLFLPTNVIRYTYGNLTTDVISKWLTTNPGLAKHFAKAVRDLRAQARGETPTPELLGAIRHGVLDSLTDNEARITAELPWQDEFKEFQPLPARFWSAAKRYTANGGSNFPKLWERFIRYAKYLQGLEQLQGDPAKVNYGGANMAYVRGIGDSAPGANDARERQAARIARDTFVDYQDITVNGDWLRKHLMPFYSWTEGNTKYHANLFRNAWQKGVDATPPGSPPALRASANVAALLAQLSAPWILLYLWNHRDDDAEELEKGLSDEDRRRLHLTLGRDEETGKTRLIYLPEAMDDLLGWIGGQTMLQQIPALINGETTLGNAMKETATAALNKAAGSINPAAKAAYEAVSGKSTFPDITDQRTIPAYDKWWKLIGNLTDDNVVNWTRAFADEDFYPSKSAWETASQLVLQVRYRDPETWAYYTIRDKADEFADAKTGGSREPGAVDLPHLQTLRNFRRAIYTGDLEAAHQFYSRLLDFGYTAEKLEASVRGQHPLAALRKDLQKEFLASLSDHDRWQYEQALAHYAKIEQLKGKGARLFPSEKLPAPARERRAANLRQNPPALIRPKDNPWMTPPPPPNPWLDR